MSLEFYNSEGICEDREYFLEEREVIIRNVIMMFEILIIICPLKLHKAELFQNMSLHKSQILCSVQKENLPDSCNRQYQSQVISTSEVATTEDPKEIEKIADSLSQYATNIEKLERSLKEIKNKKLPLRVKMDLLASLKYSSG